MRTEKELQAIEAQIRADCERNIDASRQDFKRQKLRDAMNETATQLYDQYQALQCAGFNEEQAWALTKMIVAKASFYK